MDGNRLRSKTLVYGATYESAINEESPASNIIYGSKGYLVGLEGQYAIGVGRIQFEAMIYSFALYEVLHCPLAE
jgi:hypothetical protein